MPKVLYVQYTDPRYYPPLLHGSRILADHGWEASFLGVANACDEQTRRDIAGRSLRLMRRASPGLMQKVHYFLFCLWIFGHTLRLRPDLVYASDLFACLPVGILSAILRQKFVYHEHDSPFEGSTSLFVAVCLAARRYVAARSLLCVLPSNDRADAFAIEFGVADKTKCVWNCPALSEAVRRRDVAAVCPLWLYYHGSIVPARLPMSVVEAIALLSKDVHLRLVGYETIGHPGYVRELLVRASELGVIDRIEVISPRDRNEVMKWAGLSSIGLALMPLSTADFNEQTMAGASNKPFDYMASGMPFIVSTISTWQSFFVSQGYAVSCNPDDPVSIASAVEFLSSDTRQLCEMGETGRQRILAEWNYECQFEPVRQVIDEAVR